MSHPRVCASCGINFMKKNAWDELEKKCNSCLNKEQKPKQKAQLVKLSIECTPEDHLKIEEICFSSGKTFSEYFIELHKKNLESTRPEEEKKFTKKTQKPQGI